MIRINLLAVERERTKKSRRLVVPAAQRVTIGASFILIATVISVAWWFLMLRQRSARVDAEIARAEVETQQLRSVLTQVQKFESRKAQLQQRVNLIEQLRRGQSAPVHVLDEISRSLPDRLWLTDMTQTGNDFVLSGFTTSLTALSDFVGSLESTKWFKKPVEIIDSQVTTDKKAGDLVKFSVKAALNDPEAPPPPPTTGRGAGRGAARGKP